MQPSHPDELERIKTEYEKREQRFAGSDKYSFFKPANLFRAQQLERSLLKLLRQKGFSSLDRYNVLEIGCGKGGVLLDFLSYGVTPEHLNGMDLLFFRLKEARKILPNARLVCADGQDLPYSSHAFDIELQFTVFSSILDEAVKHKLANEMLRVLKPEGILLWYDFWLNPSNRETSGIRPKEIRKLFPSCRLTFQRITLAPPLARYSVPVSWLLSSLIENLKFLNTHYLVAVQK